MIPVTSTFTKAKSVADDNALTITPRIGRNFNPGNKGNPALNVGGNHGHVGQNPVRPVAVSR